MNIIRIKITFLIATVFGLLTFIRRLFDELATDGDDIWQAILLDELSATWLAAVLLLPVISKTFSNPPWQWPKWLLYIPYAILFALTHTICIYFSRVILYPLLGLGSYQYCDIALRFIMEAPVQLMIFGTVMLILYVIYQGEHARRTEHLRTLLAKNQMQALQHQLAPHFLFNILNTISNKVFESPKKADQLIGQLADLLREVLSNSQETIISFDKELELAIKYIDLQKYRFENRVTFKTDIDSPCLESKIPALTLQPLIENIFKHGQSAEGHINILITAKHDENKLLITIKDNGPGLSGGSPIIEGIGISNVRKRLHLIFGNKANIDMRSDAEIGTVVTLELPKCE